MIYLLWANSKPRISPLSLCISYTCVQREMQQSSTYGTAIDKAPTLASSGFSTNMSLVAFSGAVSLKSMNSKVPLGDRINMNPPLWNCVSMMPFMVQCLLYSLPSNA